MTTIDKIRAEIDRRYEENREKARYDDYYRGMNDGLDLFESFLDTLEEPVSEDLEDCLELNEAAGEYERNNRCSVLGNVDIIDAFIAGAEWQKDKDTEAVIVAEDRGFLKGADWARAEMMEEWLKDREGCFWDGVNEGKKLFEAKLLDKSNN